MLARLLTEENWDALSALNMKSVFLTCKHVLPVMREQGSGAIINISSIAAVLSRDAIQEHRRQGERSYAFAGPGNARYGIRVNAIMPGLMNTPMAIETVSGVRGIDRETLVRERDAQVPLGAKMGSARISPTQRSFWPRTRRSSSRE